MVLSALKRLRIAAPLFASTVVVVTLMVCMTITKINHVYVGGLAWPYFSDMGRDQPGYSAFCVGLSITALALICTWGFNYQLQSASLARPVQLGHVPPGVRWIVLATMLCGTLSTIGLPVMAFWSTSSDSGMHNAATYWFFLFETFAIAMNTFVSWTILQSLYRFMRESSVCFDPRGPVTSKEYYKLTSARRTFYMQSGCTCLFFMAFLLYLPVGRALVQVDERLSIADCLAYNLGERYCTVAMRLDDTQTTLWSYEKSFAANQMRAASQLLCILTLLGYSTSFVSHNYEHEVDDPAPTTPPLLTHFYSIAAVPVAQDAQA